MVADAIRDCSRRKGIVLDPFAGSGTALIAAERTGRRGFETAPSQATTAFSPGYFGSTFVSQVPKAQSRSDGERGFADVPESITLRVRLIFQIENNFRDFC